MKNYIGNNNEINKKKYKKSLPPKLNPDAGNVEHNIDMFNKASSGDANLSSAAGMNGMAESYDRDSLIARITEFGKHYNFDKYTDAQLNAMLNRLVDASNHKKKVLPKYQDKINIQSDRHIMNDDPSYNFDDPERQGEYRVENLREALNRLDHYCIDNDKRFHDLRSLYENIQHQLTPEEKQELKKLVDTTNDPDAIKAYIDSKDPDKKNEDLKEDLSDYYSDILVGDTVYHKDYGEGIIKQFDYKSTPSREDTIYVTFSKDHYGNELSKKVNRIFPFPRAFEVGWLRWLNHPDSIELDNLDIDYTDIDFDESLNEGALDNLKARRQARLDKIDAKKRAEDPLYDKMRSWEEKEQHKDDPIYNFVYDQKFKYSGSKYGVTQVPKNVVSAIIKNNAESISPDAFKDCTRLKEVKFENKIIMIGKRAFMNCTSLTNMELPETVHTIEDEAFKGCSNLQHLVIPNRKVDIGQNVFEGCTKLQKNKNESLKLNSFLNEDLSEEDFEGEIFDIFDILADATKVAGGDSDDTSGNIESSDYLMDRLTCSFNSTTEISNKNFIKKVQKSIKQALENQTRFKNSIDIYVALNRYSDLPADLKKKYKNYIIEIEAYADNNDPLSRANWQDETDADFDESLNEDTVKQGNKWVNKGKEGTHGKFKTKKAADAQRKAMFANGYKGESLKEDLNDATDIVDWMYQNYPEWDYYNEWQVSPGKVKLLFKKSNNAEIVPDFEESLRKQQIDFTLHRPNKLQIIAYDLSDDEDATMEVDWDDSTDVDFDESLKRSRLNEKISGDVTYLIGIYGDEIPGFKSLDSFLDHLESKGLTIVDSDGDMDYGWDITVSGPGKILYNTINNKVPGYNCSTLEDFIEQYSLGDFDDTVEVDWDDTTDVDFDESLKLKESSPVNYKKKISLIREIDKGIPYSMRYKEADIVNDYDNDELILYWVTEDPFTKGELQEFAFYATECCHDIYDDIMQIALTYRGISRGVNFDYGGDRLIWIDAAGEWDDTDWNNYVNHMKKVGVDVEANDLIAADWEDSTDFDFDESLKLKKKRR